MVKRGGGVDNKSLFWQFLLINLSAKGTYIHYLLNFSEEVKFHLSLFIHLFTIMDYIREYYPSLDKLWK